MAPTPEFATYHLACGHVRTDATPGLPLGRVVHCGTCPGPDADHMAMVAIVRPRPT